MSDFFQELQKRNFIHQTTDDEKIKKLLNSKEKINFYMGIDPTASSVHVGHFSSLMLFKRLIDKGHKGILLFGGATSYIGDPSGKDSMRKLLTRKEIDSNIESLVSQAKNVIGDNFDFVNNFDWTKDMSYLDFMRDIGPFFNVNKMLNSECYANRIEKGGLTFLELGYMPLQAYDFYYLNKKKDCILQIGGSDQWGNIVAGVELNRRKSFDSKNKKQELFGLTMPLLLTSEGKKMGKSENGAIWLNEELTSVYDFYQYFYNVDDLDVEKLLLLFTDFEIKKIKEMISLNIVEAKKTMAYEITKLVHGEDKAKSVKKASEELFNNSNVKKDVPSTDFSFEKIEKGINVLDFLVQTSFLNSKSEGRRLIKQNGLSINDEKQTDFNLIIDKSFIEKDQYILLKKGKKTFLKVNIK